MTLKAVIMAGGKGTRLRPITYSIPKPLVPIAGKPCIGYALDSYFKAGIKNAIITTGYKFESLISGVLAFKNEDQNILFSVEKEPAGTAGSVKLVSKFIDETFIVGSGDTLSDFNISNILKFHREKKAKLTIALTHVDDTSQFGIVEMKDGFITRFLEKPSPEESFSNLINTGIYVMEPEILEHIPCGMPYDFAKDLFPVLLKEGVKIAGYQAEGTWLDAGRPKDMIAANQLMTEKYGTKITGEGFKGKAIIRTPLETVDNLKLEGPIYVGQNVYIGKNATISRSAIYDGVSIGDDVVVEDSMLMDNSRVLNGTRIEKSVIMKHTSIGENCEISESVLSPNLNLQSKSRIYNVSLSSEILDDEN
ncbi:MAG: NDP-sugar synthase [Thermoplasmataceae archaeon]